MKKEKKTSQKAAPIAAELAEATATVEITKAATPVATDKVAAMVEKARIARQAAALGLYPQEEADALWEEAVAACKPSDEAIQAAKDAKAKADETAKVFRVAKAAFEMGMVTEDFPLRRFP